MSPVRTDWDLAFILLVVLLNCIVKKGNRKRPCVLSMTTLPSLMKCNPMIGSVNFFIETKCFATVYSPIPNLSVAVANRFSNWSFAVCIRIFRRSLILKKLTVVFF